MDMITVQTEHGIAAVPAYKHAGCAHLCVTMSEFGSFEVAHIKSGMSVCSGFRDFIEAKTEMLKMSIALCNMGLADNASGAEFERLASTDTIIPNPLGMPFMDYVDALKDQLWWGNMPTDGDDSMILERLDKKLDCARKTLAQK